MGRSRASKWKMNKGESLVHKITKPRTFRKFDKMEQFLILSLVLFVGIFTSAYGYYQFNVVPTLPNASNDPFTLIYNGTSGPVFVPTYKSSTDFIGCDPGDAGCTISGISVRKNDLIVVSATGYNVGCANILYTDSQSNSYTVQVGWLAGGNGYNSQQVLTAFAGLTGTFSVTQSAYACSWTSFIVTIVSGVQSVGQNNVSKNSAITINNSTTTLPYFSNAINLQFLTVMQGGGNPCPTVDFSSSQYVSTCDNFDMPGEEPAIVAAKTTGKVTSYTYNWTYLAGNTPYSHVGIQLLGTANPCIYGYTCQNARGDIDGVLNLSANSTYPGIAVSNSPIDFSSAASKELFWYETFQFNGTHNSQPFGWFLTTNQTFASQSNYLPFNDSSVVLLNIAYPVGPIVNYYNYQAKTAGQSLLLASGLGENPYPTCPQTSTLYICAHGNVVTSAQFRAFSMTMNYTGTTGSASPNGASLTCDDASPTVGPNIYDFCLMPQDTTPCTLDAFVCGTTLFPYLNVNGGPYYLGFWSAAGQTGNIQFGTSANGPFARRANLAFVWVPNPCGGTAVNCTQSTTDSGGFLGWLGHTVGTAFSVAGNVLGMSFSPLLNIGGSVMGAAMSAIVQAVSILILAYRVSLNYIGNLLHLGNLGDLLFDTLTAIGALIVNGFSAIVGFFVGLGTLINSGFFTFLASAAVLIAVLLPFAITLWKIIFNGAFTVTDIMFFDYVLGIFMVFHAIEKRQSALKAFLGWAMLNVFIFTFIFNAAWTIFDIVTRPIHRTKETVDPVG